MAYTKKHAPHLALITEIVLALCVACSGVMLTATAVSAATAATTISSTVTSVMGLFTSSGAVNVNITPSAAGTQTIASDTITVSTSGQNGYTLQISRTGAESALVSGADTIPAAPGTQASPSALTANSWGYRVDGIGGFGAGPTSGQSSAAVSAATFAAVPASASPNTIKVTSSTATNDTTAVWFSVVANTTLPTGTYTNSVTYTGIAN